MELDPKWESLIRKPSRCTPDNSLVLATSQTGQQVIVKCPAEFREITNNLMDRFGLLELYPSHR
jgi:hypothetical protein